MACLNEEHVVFGLKRLQDLHDVVGPAAQQLAGTNFAVQLRKPAEVARQRRSGFQ